MSDNKKWFKVWTSILNDPEMSDLPLEDVGRWMRLGAMIASVGENGKLLIKKPASHFCFQLKCHGLEDALMACKRLPNVSIQETNNDHGSFIVIMRNWSKYQVDTTHTERQKRSRYKKRGEEKRRLTSTSTSTSSLRASRPLGGAVATREIQNQEEKNGTIRGKSVYEQTAELRAKERAEELRNQPPPGEILARIRNLPKVQPET